MLLAKRKIFFAIVMLIVFLVLFIMYKKPAAGEKVVLINGNKIEIEVANIQEARYRGLSNRDFLCLNCGMLFVFSNKELRTFVMRDMKFDLDMIWIADGKIVDIHKNVMASNPKKMYSSEIKVDMVLEVNAGYCDKFRIKIGDTLDLTF